MTAKLKMLLTAIAFLISMILDVVSTRYAMSADPGGHDLSIFGFTSVAGVALQIAILMTSMYLASRHDLLSWTGLVFSAWRVVVVVSNVVLINHQTPLEMAVLVLVWPVMVFVMCGVSCIRGMKAKQEYTIGGSL